MIDRGVVCAQLSRLRERRKILEELAAVPADAFTQDPNRISAAERQLQISIEICLDVGQHLIAALALPRPEEYRDVFRILGKHGVLTPVFAARLEKMAGFGNRLVHVYADIEPQLVHQFLGENRADFDEFARQIAAFVASRPSGG